MQLNHFKSKQTMIEELIAERKNHEKEKEKFQAYNTNLKKELAQVDISYMGWLD